MKENKYLVDYTYKDRVRIELVFPSYASLNKDLGLYWSLGVSLSLERETAAVLRVGLIIGWFQIVVYK